MRWCLLAAAVIFSQSLRTRPAPEACLLTLAVGQPVRMFVTSATSWTLFRVSAMRKCPLTAGDKAEEDEDDDVGKASGDRQPSEPANAGPEESENDDDDSAKSKGNTVRP